MQMAERGEYTALLVCPGCAARSTLCHKQAKHHPARLTQPLLPPDSGLRSRAKEELACREEGREGQPGRKARRRLLMVQRRDANRKTGGVASRAGHCWDLSCRSPNVSRDATPASPAAGVQAARLAARPLPHLASACAAVAAAAAGCRLGGQQLACALADQELELLWGA
jgi:uncharacterized protein YbaR (Trm112 family)